MGSSVNIRDIWAGGYIGLNFNLQTQLGSVTCIDCHFNMFLQLSMI
jgi:hypothetical protein